ncbi:hypothetical protein [Campylobacter geochelonis]|uniref:Uncharacterized protein n=1 Tax=Campylobacter geochelonis TaxID=1780362 RepID=A0A128EGT0_9BACT|nr:hypothetical protein [Campylobacter geochelonis]QKF70807.1 hypothetical protein CGEO_0478 [Campylobacter geochelonis]CZE48095.1 Uncharacterised protein [Campylobacter geochelonis]
MQIIGYDLIEFEYFYKVIKLDDIVKFDNLLFSYDENFIASALEFKKTFSVIASDENHILLANALGAKFIITHLNNLNLVKKAVKLSEFYLFDSKIACIINDEKQLRDVANLGADTAIFEKAIKI